MLAEKVKDFPKACGVYMMKDTAGLVLYVGKAKNLKARVQAYFRKESKTRYQIGFLMRKTADIEYLVTDNEKEALLLENTLIRKHKPRYNIYFKDDKSYASLKLNIKHPFPALFITRNIVKDGSLYFGPYASAGALRQTLDLLTKHFKLRTCSDHEFANRSRPCLEYHIGRCTAPCVGKVTAEDYARQVEEARLFLSGRKNELIHKLKEKMSRASRELHYEEAAPIRDLIHYVQETLEQQKVVHHQGRDYDAIGFALTREKTDSHGRSFGTGGTRCARGSQPMGVVRVERQDAPPDFSERGFTPRERIVFCILMVRQGILLDRQQFVCSRPIEINREFLTHFLLQYYGLLLDVPPEILLPEPIEGLESLQEIFREHAGHAVSLLMPRRGEKKKMVALAQQNASQWAQTKIQSKRDVLENLQAKLVLPQIPAVIECVDISNLQGKEAVGSLVCFGEGAPLKNRYRKFRIRLNEGPNDYAMMYEVLSRRFRRALQWPPPDLLLVDGGKGQLQIALKALADLGMHGLSVAAIAKARGDETGDKIYIPGRKNPVGLKANSPELLYLMKIRDEAHRFGITYHRLLRGKKLFSVTRK